MPRLHIWDTAGEEQYRSMTRYFLREAVIGLVVYDVTDPKSASNMDEWINCLLEESPDCQIIVVGNKIDSTNRKVDAENIRKYATANQFEMLECSAKSGENIFEVFCKAAVIAYKQRNSYNGSVKSDAYYVVCLFSQTTYKRNWNRSCHSIKSSSIESSSISSGNSSKQKSIK